MNKKLLIYGVAAVLIVAVSLPAALSLKIKTDIASLLPKGGAFIAAQSAVEFPAFKSITVMIESPTSPLTSERSGAAIDGMAAAIRGIDAVATARAGLNDEEKAGLFKTLFTSRFYLAGYDDPAAMRAIKLAPMKLTLPGGDALRATLGADPIGLTERLAAILQGGSRGSMDLIDGRFYDDGGKRAFITVRASESYRGIEKLEDIIANIERLFEEDFSKRFPAGTTMAVTGGAALACDSAGIMKGDLSRAAVLSVAGLILFFIFILRSFRLPLLFIPPVAVGAVAGMAGVSLIQGEIHGLTLGFGIALIGLCDDYLMHILVAYSMRGNMKEAVSEVFPSITVAFVLTLCSLLALSFSGLPVIKEIAILGIIGLSAAFFVSMTLSVALSEHFRLAPNLTQAVTVEERPGVIFTVGVILATVVLGFFAMQVKYDGNLKRLNANHPEVEAAFKRMRQSLDGGGTRWIAISPGKDEAEAYEACGRLAEALDAKKLSHTAPCSVTPPLLRQLKNLESYRALDRKKFYATAEASGMRPDAFAPFFRALDSALAGQAAPLTAASLPPSFLKEAIEDATFRSDKGVSLMTVIQSNEAAPIKEAANTAGGSFLFDFAQVENGLVALLKKELPLLLATCVSLIWICLAFYYRNIWRASLALLPPALSIIWLLGAVKIAGYDVNAVVVCCIIFQFGIGLDYAAYTLGHSGASADHSLSQTAIRFSAASTIISFATLLTAANPALFVIGLAVCAGILGSMFISRLFTLLPMALLFILFGTGCASYRPLALVAEPVTFTGTVELARPNGPTRIYLSRLVLDPAGYRLALLIPPGVPYLVAEGAAGSVRADCAFSNSACLYDAQVLSKALKRIFDPETGGAERAGPGYTIKLQPGDGRWAALRSLEYREQMGYLFRFAVSGG
jgi:predicted exporter